MGHIIELRKEHFNMNATAPKNNHNYFAAKKLNMKNVKKAIIDRELSLVEVAKILGVNINTVSRWVNGNNLQQIENFLKLLSLLDLDIDDIYK